MARRSELLAGRGIAFLASQVGAHSSRLWAERVGALQLDSRQAMLIWNVAIAEGRSQRELAESLHLPESRIVELVDALEARGWLKRRTNARDRRAREIHLTPQGNALLDRILVVAADHEDEFTTGLPPEDRAVLVKLLTRVAARQGLIARVHPDF